MNIQILLLLSLLYKNMMLLSYKNMGFQKQILRMFNPPRKMWFYFSL